MFDLSETEGGESCSLALNACQEIFDDILQIVGDINVSNYMTEQNLFKEK